MVSLRPSRPIHAVKLNKSKVFSKERPVSSSGVLKTVDVASARYVPRPATMDLARARPTLSVVRGSRRGGAGAGARPAQAHTCHNHSQNIYVQVGSRNV